jgi:hypothetical protein
MDESMYSEKNIKNFIKSKLCQDDELLYKYYQGSEVEKFQNRISKFGKEADDAVKTAFQTCITDVTRDVILSWVRILSRHMKPYGDLIVSGGEAINAYLESENRIITTDIDTKFTPLVKLQNKLLNASNEKMFGFIQFAKLKMWNKIGQIAKKFRVIIVKRIRELLGPVVGKLLGVSFSGIRNPLTRRYTLIKKNKNEGVLIDIELFAIDLQVKYYVPTKKKISSETIGGLLDIAYMRPKEFGFEATYTKSKGLYITNPVTHKTIYDKSLMVASEKFLIEDIYALQKYNLRPTKKEKDRKRLLSFAKHVLGIKVQPRETIEKIYQKSMKAVGVVHTSLLARPNLTEKEMKKVLLIDPYRYKNITSKPSKERVYKQLFYGIKGSSNLKVPGYEPTLSNYRFNVHKENWVKNTDPLYIHNEATYRPSGNIKNFPSVRLQDTLYGYNPARDRWMPKELVDKAASIPLVGLKITFLK